MEKTCNRIVMCVDHDTIWLFPTPAPYPEILVPDGAKYPGNRECTHAMQVSFRIASELVILIYSLIIKSLSPFCYVCIRDAGRDFSW